ncbi:MAG: hypothetical protein IH840_03690 [Candidatus Heimdallarchaeota archaeon]|nr:hypothetical protein [Candidatus Heimdallarchaeota archaeon]
MIKVSGNRTNIFKRLAPSIRVIILLLIITGSMFIGFNPKSIVTPHRGSDLASISSTPYEFSNTKVNDIEVKIINADSKQGIVSNTFERLQTHGVERGNPLLALETTNAESGITFTYEENETVVLADFKQFNDNITISTLNGIQNNKLLFGFDIFTNQTSVTIEDAATGTNITLRRVQTDIMFVQGYQIPQVNHSGITVDLQDFSIEATHSLGDLTGSSFVGGLWTAKQRAGDGAIIPDTQLGTDTYMTAGGGETSDTLAFSLSTAQSISTSNTFSNASGAFVFFTFYFTAGENSWLMSYDDQDGTDDGPTYFLDTGDIPPSPSADNDWGDPFDLDYTVSFDTIFQFDPHGIETRISVPVGDTGTLVQPSGIWIDNTTRTVDTTYRVSYNQALVNGLTPNLNITYIKFQSITDFVDITYSSQPGLALINWSIIFTNTYNKFDSDVNKYFSIPSHFTITSVSLGNTVLTNPANYTTATNGNTTVRMLVADGDYKINATSSNLLETAVFETKVNNGSGAVVSSVGFMGVIYPIPDKGDLVNANITNIGNLGLTSGSYNASLRGEDGSIGGNNSVGTYEDHWVSTENFSFTNLLNFSTYLDPNQTIGVWTFQFRWNNGTHAGATAIEFDVLPITTIELLDPTGSTEIIDDNSVDIVVKTLDQSHNRTWSTPGNIVWQFGEIPLTYDGFHTDNINHQYSGSLTPSFSVDGVGPGSYNVGIEFWENIHSDFVNFTLIVYHNGSTNFSFPTDVEFGSNITLNVTPYNVTGDSIFNKSAVIFDVDFPFTSTYNPGDGSHLLNVQWDNSFTLGLNNLDVRWQDSNFREVLTTELINDTYSFTVLDTTNPMIYNFPDTVIFIEDSSGNQLSWNAKDYNPDRWEVTRNGTSYDSGMWINGTAITIDIDESKGFYEFQLTVNDTDGNEHSDLHVVQFIDTTLPTFSLEPADLSSFEDGTSFDVGPWNSSDSHPAFYELFVDGMKIDNGTWNNSELLEFNFDNIGLGKHTIILVIYDESGNSESSTIIIIVEDTTAPVLVSPTQADFRYFEGDTGNTISWTVTDLNPRNYSITLNGQIYKTDSWISNDPIIIDVDGLSIGEHTFEISIFDKADNSITRSVTITVKSSSVTETAVVEFELITNVYEGDVEIAIYTWNTSSGDSISEANITAFLMDVDSMDLENDQVYASFQATSAQNGSVELIFNYTSVLPGSFKWVIFFSKGGHENKSLLIMVNVLPHNLRIEIQSLDELVKNEEYTISATLYYDNKQQRTTTYNPKTGTAEGVNVTFEISLVYEDGDEGGETITITKRASTNSGGIATIVLTESETTDVREIQGITVRIEAGGQFAALSVEIDSSEFPTIVDPSLNFIQQFFVNLGFDIGSGTDVFTLFAIFIVTLAILVFLIRKIKTRRKEWEKQITRESKTAQEELEALLSINAVIIRNSAGIPFYNKTFSSERISVDLISGLTTAISSFMDEVSNVRTERFETIQRSGFHITTCKGAYCAMTIISDSPLPKVIQQGVDRAVELIELLFGSDIEDAKRVNLIPVEDVFDMMEEATLKIGINYPLKINTQHIDRIMKIKSIRRNIRSGISILKEVPNVSSGEINKIIGFLKEKNLPMDQISKIIIIAYSNEILVRA